MSPAPMIATVVMIRWSILLGAPKRVARRRRCMSTLTGTSAVVTGGSRGIGLAIARALLDRGASVMITGTSEKHLADASRGLQSAARGGSVIAHVADVRKYDEVDGMFNEAASRFGGIDELVNNAGGGVFTRVSEMAVRQGQDVIQPN